LIVDAVINNNLIFCCGGDGGIETPSKIFFKKPLQVYSR